MRVSECNVILRRKTNGKDILSKQTRKEENRWRETRRRESSGRAGWLNPIDR